MALNITKAQALYFSDKISVSTKQTRKSPTQKEGPP